MSKKKNHKNNIAQNNFPKAPIGSAPADDKNYAGAQTDIEMQTDSSDSSKKKSIKLDQIVKDLFNVTHKVLLDMLNSIFDTEYNIDNITLTGEDSEFVTPNYDLLRGDLLFKVDTDKEEIHYHIELQTRQDESMVIRMMEYGFNNATKDYSHDKGNAIIPTLTFPKQRVIFLERNRSIDDILVGKLILPDNTEVTYKVPTIKLWNYTKKSLVERKLYPLIPLDLLKLRNKLRNFDKKNYSTIRKNNYVKELKNDLQETMSLIIELKNKNLISSTDLNTMLNAALELSRFYNTRYIKSENFEKEVIQMNYAAEFDAAMLKGKIEGEKSGEIKGTIKSALAMQKLSNLSDEETLLLLQQLLNTSPDEAKQALDNYLANMNNQ